MPETSFPSGPVTYMLKTRVLASLHYTTALDLTILPVVSGPVPPP
jgi:hypothetical protein